LADDDGEEHEDTYTVAFPIASLDTIYANIAASMMVEITDAVRMNARPHYSRTSSGGG
jgi:hypothetical protein